VLAGVVVAFVGVPGRLVVEACFGASVLEGTSLVLGVTTTKVVLGVSPSVVTTLLMDVVGLATSVVLEVEVEVSTEAEGRGFDLVSSTLSGIVVVASFIVVMVVVSGVT
jgi:hypothetical protein